ncbi:hypothetical protein [Colwellia sp. UCD-KL20]|uniref:hypothetical protein n=1 Tax=Colwellia sp. UCD-KL20 TaxID=1917165 RepID=UPI000970EA9C|nr:hypothetical protein [Colwellia sp. UCD-KL20]
MNSELISPDAPIKPPKITLEPIVDHYHNVFAYELFVTYSNAKMQSLPVLLNSKHREYINKLFIDEIEKIPEHILIFTRLPVCTFTTEHNVAKRIVEEIEFINNFGSFGDSIVRLKIPTVQLGKGCHVNEPLHDVTFVKFKVEIPTIRTLLKIKKVKYQYPESKIIISHIDSENTLEQLKEEGCDYFQGKQVSRQLFKKTKDENQSNMVNLALIITVLDKQIPFLLLFEKCIQDKGLIKPFYYFLNVFFKKKKVEFTSYKQMVTHLGEGVLRKVVLITLMQELSRDNSKSLSVISLTRAHFISAMLKSKGVKYRGNGYLVGLLSLLDCMLNEDIESIVFQLHLPSDVMRALLDHHGVLGNLLLICKMMENHKWFDVNKLCKEYSWCVDKVIKKYAYSLDFATQIFMSTSRV